MSLKLSINLLIVWETKWPLWWILWLCSNKCKWWWEVWTQWTKGTQWTQWTQWTLCPWWCPWILPWCPLLVEEEIYLPKDLPSAPNLQSKRNKNPKNNFPMSKTLEIIWVILQNLIKRNKDLILVKFFSPWSERSSRVQMMFLESLVC